MDHRRKACDRYEDPGTGNRKVQSQKGAGGADRSTEDAELESAILREGYVSKCEGILTVVNVAPEQSLETPSASNKTSLVHGLCSII